MCNYSMGAAGAAYRLLVLSAVALLPTWAQAQGTGTVRGKVTRMDENTPLSGVHVSARGTGMAGVTRPDGTYQLERVPAGQQTILFRWLGYRPQEIPVTVTAGGTTTADAALQAQPVALEEVVVSASRTPERVVEAPAAVSIADVSEIRAAAITGQLPKVIENLPGVDLVQSGMADYNVNTRGFNSSLNRRVLVLEDGRDLSIAFLGAQEWNANPPPEDAARVEFVRGPGSALYGANAFSGVLSITTPAARDIRGTRVTLSGGELNSFRADFRHAGVLSQGRVGYKLGGGYSTSDTWSRSRTAHNLSDYTAEYAAAGATSVNPPTFGYERRALNGQDTTAGTGIATGSRDPIVSGFGTGRLDYYATSGAVGTVEGGAAQVQNELFVTGIGRVQVAKALRPWARATWAAKNYNVMAWYSGRDSRDPQYSLASGLPLQEHSSIYHVEGQYNHGFLRDKGNVVVGGSFRNTHVNTRSTLMAPVNDNRSDNYGSGYGQVEYALAPQLRVVGAARWDKGDLFAAQFSPKGAIVFSPNERHSLRFTFNRAFQTPNYSEFFLRVPVSSPQTGPRTLERNLEAFFTAMNASLGPAVASLNLPNSLAWNFDSLTNVLALGNAALAVEKVNGWEFGYKGDFPGKGYVTVDGYLNFLRNFVTDLLPAAVLATGNPAYQFYDITQPVNARNKLDSLDTRIQQLQAANQISAAQAAAIRANIAALRAGYNSLAAGLGPLFATFTGTTTRAGVVSYTNAGRVTERGVELGAGYFLTNELKVEGSYTFFDFDVKQAQAGDSLLPNTPKHKGTLTASYSGRQGLDATVTWRIVDGFNWAAGVYAGRIPSSEVVDVNLGYRVNNYVRLFALGTNILDQKRFSLYGGSVNGRRALGGVTATF